MSQDQRLSLGKRASWVGIISNLTLTIVKATIGYIAGSTAMIADAFNSGTDIVGNIVVLQGLRIAHRPPDEEHHYGHGKAESVISKIIAILLMTTAIGIGVSAFNVLRNPYLEAPGIIAIWPALLSIVSKEVLYRYTVKVGRTIQSQALIADAWNHRTDAFSSFAALIGIIGANFGFPILDPIAGIVVAIMILKAAISIYRDAINELMDTAPPKEVMEKIKDITFKINGIHEVQDLKARKHGNQIYVDMKICVDRHISVEEGHDLATKAKQHIISNIENMKDVLIHVNPCSVQSSRDLTSNSIQKETKKDD